MMIKMKMLAVVLAVSVTAAPTSSAFAESRHSQEDQRSERFDEGDAQAFSRAKVSLTQAVAAAEAAVGGKVVDARFERHDAPAWEIEIARADGMMKAVLVDASTGAVDQSPRSRSDEGDEDGSDGEE